MFTRIYRPIAIAVVICMVLLVAAVTPVSAVSEPATSRDGAGAPLPGWFTLAPGASHWYKFTYDYNDSDEPPQAFVMVKAEMPNAMSFAIETAANLARPKYDEDGNWRNPVGVGSLTWIKTHNHDGTPEEIQAQFDAQNEHGFYVKNEMALSWAGSTKATETFYVIVTNQHDHPCAYMIDISGKTVSY
jgi:hypothetical protein